jgi:hypothetical protein
MHEKIAWTRLRTSLFFFWLAIFYESIKLVFFLERNRDRIVNSAPSNANAVLECITTELFLLDWIHATR